jgi:GntR family transcriptional regulator
MPLIRENVASLYEQIASLLREEIGSGLYEPSGKLPSEAELCTRFSVSRVTVRLALAKLDDEGVVERKQGKGTYAKGKQLRHGLDRLRSFHDSLVMLGLNPEMRLVSRDIISIPKHLRSLLGAGDRKRCLLLQRLHVVDGEPIALGRSHLPIEVQKISWEMTEQQPTYSILEKMTGMQVARADLTIKVGQTDVELAAALGLKVGAPLLLMERTSYFSNGACCDHSTFYIRPERYAFVMQTSFAQAQG